MILQASISKIIQRELISTTAAVAPLYAFFLVWHADWLSSYRIRGAASRRLQSNACSVDQAIILLVRRITFPAAFQEYLVDSPCYCEKNTRVKSSEPANHTETSTAVEALARIIAKLSCGSSLRGRHPSGLTFLNLSENDHAKCLKARTIVLLW